MTRISRPLTPGRYYDRIAALRIDIIEEAAEAARAVLRERPAREAKLLARVAEADREEALRLESTLTLPLPGSLPGFPPEEPIPYTPIPLKRAEPGDVIDAEEPDDEPAPSLSPRLLAPMPEGAPVIERDNATGRSRRVT